MTSMTRFYLSLVLALLGLAAQASHDSDVVVFRIHALVNLQP